MNLCFSSSGSGHIFQLILEIKREWVRFKKWFKVKLLLNEKKTEFTVFVAEKAKDNITLHLNKIENEDVYGTKCLGAIIDHQLN